MTDTKNREKKKKVAVLGATGSIGKNALDVLRRNSGFFEPVLFSSNTDRLGLAALSREFPGAKTVLTGTDRAEGVDYSGRAGLLRAIAECGGHIALNGIAGSAGLDPSLAVIEAGMDLALANKETIVMAASLVFAAAGRRGVKIIPVDSEHSAVFTLAEAHGREYIEEIMLTASGGPFRQYPIDRLKAVTAQEALAHPTWRMGAKITVDSATLANKGLEVIEAARLFALPPERIKAVIHPQSVVHSMVRCRDGAVYAQMSRPDMRLPIQSALFYPDRACAAFEELSFDALTLEFSRPDEERFPMLALAYKALRAGELYPAAYNAANEFAVAAFLSGRIGFFDISGITGAVLDRDWSGSADLETVWETHRLAARFAETVCRF